MLAFLVMNWIGVSLIRINYVNNWREALKKGKRHNTKITLCLPFEKLKNKTFKKYSILLTNTNILVTDWPAPTTGTKFGLRKIEIEKKILHCEKQNTLRWQFWCLCTWLQNIGTHICKISALYIIYNTKYLCWHKIPVLFCPFLRLFQMMKMFGYTAGMRCMSATLKIIIRRANPHRPKDHLPRKTMTSQKHW